MFYFTHVYAVFFLMIRPPPRSFFFFNDTATTEIYTLSLHDALPILLAQVVRNLLGKEDVSGIAAIHHAHRPTASRSEEHTSELQSRLHLVCRLLLEKKKKLQTSSLP